MGVKRIAAVGVIAISIATIAAAPAQATEKSTTTTTATTVVQVMTPPSCPNLGNPWSAWQQPSGSWGRFRYCLTVDPQTAMTWFYAELDDIASDTYQVHMEKFTSCPEACWKDINGINPTCNTNLTYASSGPVTNPCIPPAQGTLESPWSGASWGPGGGIPMHVRIVKGRGWYPGPHQFVTYGTYFLGYT